MKKGKISRYCFLILKNFLDRNLWKLSMQLKKDNYFVFLKNYLLGRNLPPKSLLPILLQITLPDLLGVDDRKENKTII